MMLCPGCRQEIKILNEYLGLKIECTLCGKRFKALVADDELRRTAREKGRELEKAIRKQEVRAHQELRRQKKAEELELLRRAAHGSLTDDHSPIAELDDLLDEAHSQPTPAPQASSSSEREFHLVTIRGKPLWVALSFVVAGLGLLPFLLRDGETTQPPSVQPAEPTVALSPQQPTLTRDIASAQHPTQDGTYRGIGWSLDQIVALWGAEGGWYRHEKKRNEAGVGMQYTAGNIETPSVVYVVRGLPANVSSVVVAASLPLQGTSGALAGQVFPIPLRMVSRLTGCSTDELMLWASELLASFSEAGTPVQGVRMCREFRMTTTFIITEGDLTLGITVERKDSEDP